MNASIGSLLEQDKKLSAEDRTALINALHDISAPPDPAWEAAWIKECEDRIAVLDSGEMQTYDFGEVMAQTRARLKRV